MTNAPQALVVLAHPRPGSLNHALAAAAVEALESRGVPVRSHDLYAEGFDPVLGAEEAYTSGSDALTVADAGDPLTRKHRREIVEASVLVVVHPNWWGKPPAMMAGWMDRVFVPGVAYALDQAAGLPTPMLSLRTLVVLNTSDTPADRETSDFGDPLDAMWRRCLAPFVGSPVVERRVFRVVADADATERATWLAEVANLLGEIDV
jgi:putative NADPH-quinone reductase